jgi:hypothetical protein
MGQDNLQERLEKKVFGMAEMRTRQAEVMDLVSNHYETVFLRDNKRCACSRSAILIHPDLCQVLLSRWEYEPQIEEKNGKFTVILKEIGARGQSENREEALGLLIEDVLDQTRSYFSEMDLHARLPETKNRYPWYLKILNCLSVEEVIRTINLEDFASL